MIDTGQTSVDLLAAIAAVERQFIVEAEPHQAFDDALKLLLELSESEYGFIGEVLHTPLGEPYLRTHAITNIAWGKATRAFCDENATRGLEFYNLQSLFGEVIRTSRVVVSNEPASDPRGGGTPAGHPPLEAFLGLPFFGGEGELVGMAGLANRPDGYDDDHVALLNPLCDALGVMIVATKRERRHREADAALRASEARYRTFVDHVTDGLFLHGEGGRVVDVNRRACESLGYERDELIGMHPTEFDPAVTWADVEKIMARLAAGNSIAFDSRHRRKDGSEFPVEVRLRPLLVDGKLFALALACDITERKRAERALRESEERLQLALTASGMGVWEWDIQTNAMIWSPGCGEILGVETNGGTIDSLIRLVHPEDLAEWREKTRRSTTEGTSNSWEFRAVGPDGRTRWLAQSVLVRNDELGQPLTLVGTVRDVTERKLKDAALRESEERFRALVEVSSQIVWTTEADGDVVEDSPSWRAFTGQSYDQWCGHGWLNVVHPADRERTANQWRQCCLTQAPVNLEYRLWHADSRSWRWMNDRGVCLRNADGSTRLWVGMSSDIHERRQAEEELAERRAELRHASRLSTIGRMVAVLSHEVAQPLSAIGNFAAACERILDDATTVQWDTLHDYVRAIVQQNQRCGEILQRLRDFGRRSSRRRTICDMNQLLRDSVELISCELRPHDVSLCLELAADLPHVAGDRIQLQQVFVNLLTNARDAVREQESDRRAITLRTSAEQDAVVLDVVDRGTGLAESVAAHLFEPFLTTKENGMGIGLNICQSIVKEHGGTIEGFSNPAGGATFRVRLPLASDSRP